MFDKDALSYSEQHTQEVLDRLKEERAYIREIQTTNLNANAKRDYWQRIDATGISATKTYTIQIKCRKPGHNDFVLTAHKIVDAQAKDQCQGFFWHGEKYTFSIFADIYAEYLGDGSIFSVTREELETLESRFSAELSERISLIVQSKRKNSSGDYFHIGEYDVFISQSDLAWLQFVVASHYNSRLRKYFAKNFELPV